jgi:hypothetical protein
MASASTPMVTKGARHRPIHVDFGTAAASMTVSQQKTRLRIVGVALRSLARAI